MTMNKGNSGSQQELIYQVQKDAKTAQEFASSFSISLILVPSVGLAFISYAQTFFTKRPDGALSRTEQVIYTTCYLSMLFAMAASFVICLVLQTSTSTLAPRMNSSSTKDASRGGSKMDPEQAGQAVEKANAIMVPTPGQSFDTLTPEGTRFKQYIFRKAVYSPLNLLLLSVIMLATSVLVFIWSVHSKGIAGSVTGIIVFFNALSLTM